MFGMDAETFAVVTLTTAIQLILLTIWAMRWEG
jgi:hypothetical protein